MLIYTVRPNETLAEIARRYGLPLQRLTSLNRIRWRRRPPPRRRIESVNCDG